MKISDFKLVDVIGTGPSTWKYKATVTVTKKTFSENRQWSAEIFLKHT